METAIAGAPAPALEVTDLSSSTWDAVVVLWTDTEYPGTVRDRVIRSVLPRVAKVSGS